MDRQIGEAVQQVILGTTVRSVLLAQRLRRGDFVANKLPSPMPPMNESTNLPWPAVLAISGHAKSGKSTLAAVLAGRLGVHTGSFGAEVRAIAIQRGISREPAPVERETLMWLGETLVAHELTEFCERVLAQAGWAPGTPVILEGVRHTAVAAELRRLIAPMPLVLVTVDTPPEVREERLSDEGGGPLTRIAMDAHSTEREVSAVLTRTADLVVDGTQGVEVNADNIIAALSIPANK